MLAAGEVMTKPSPDSGMVGLQHALLDEKGLAQPAIALWPGDAPTAVGKDLLDQPMLTVHLPDKARANGAGVIVNPGGGYRILASDHEGLQVARWLNRLGIAAFVLRYRVGPTYHSSVSLLDGLRAVRHVRANAPTYRIDGQRIGMLGFSAGGHLAAAVGTSWDLGDDGADDPVERESSRPDFIVPIYAVTNGQKRGRKADEYTPADEKVTPESSPAFIVHTHEDTIVPATQATLFYDALLAHGVAAELHIFNDGEHGLGLMPGDPDVQHWTDLLHRWMRRRGFLTSAPRTNVTGTIRLDGRSMGMVWITLLPDEPNHPIARVRINRASEGEFSIEASRGPVPGPHTLQVHHVSEQYPHVATGIYTLEDSRVHERRVDVAPGEHLELILTEGDFDGIDDAMA
jgi:acetyl esterase/lipase